MSAGITAALALIEALVTQMPVRFSTSDQDPWVMGVLVRCSRPMTADSIEQILIPSA